MLSRAGLRSLTEAVSEVMACAIWKARNEISPLTHIFKDKLSTRNTRSALSGNLCLPVPGHPESAANTINAGFPSSILEIQDSFVDIFTMQMSFSGVTFNKDTDVILLYLMCINP